MELCFDAMSYSITLMRAILCSRWPQVPPTPDSIAGLVWPLRLMLKSSLYEGLTPCSWLASARKYCPCSKPAPLGTFRAVVLNRGGGSRLTRGGSSPYALFNMESFFNKFTNKYICFYNLFKVSGVLKQRTFAPHGRRGKEKVKNHWFKGGWTSCFELKNQWNTAKKVIHSLVKHFPPKHFCCRASFSLAADPLAPSVDDCTFFSSAGDIQVQSLPVTLQRTIHVAHSPLLAGSVHPRKGRRPAPCCAHQTSRGGRGARWRRPGKENEIALTRCLFVSR